MKKCLAIGIILLFLLTVCLPVLASEGKPDLIITGLGTTPTNTPPHNWVYCVVKNIGSGTAYDDIEVKVGIKRVLFGMFLINKTLRSFFASGWSSSGLPPNNTTSSKFAMDDQLPSWGFFRIYCQVNPDKRIDEENYDNNFYVQDVFVTFGNWEKAL
jgi:hypothetical protein